MTGTTVTFQIGPAITDGTPDDKLDQNDETCWLCQHLPKEGTFGTALQQVRTIIDFTWAYGTMQAVNLIYHILVDVFEDAPSKQNIYMHIETCNLPHLQKMLGRMRVFRESIGMLKALTVEMIPLDQDEFELRSKDFLPKLVKLFNGLKECYTGQRGAQITYRIPIPREALVNSCRLCVLRQSQSKEAERLFFALTSCISKQNIRLGAKRFISTTHNLWPGLCDLPPRHGDAVLEVERHILEYHELDIRPMLSDVLDLIERYCKLADRAKGQDLDERQARLQISMLNIPIINYMEKIGPFNYGRVFPSFAIIQSEEESGGCQSAETPI